MANRVNISAQTPITGLFCELFDAASAVRTLNEMGFAETEIAYIGVFGGRVPEFSDILHEIGLPAEHVHYYNGFFEDGALLLVIHSDQSYKRVAALAILQLHGGILPPGVSPHISS